MYCDITDWDIVRSKTCLFTLKISKHEFQTFVWVVKTVYEELTLDLSRATDFFYLTSACIPCLYTHCLVWRLNYYPTIIVETVSRIQTDMQRQGDTTVSVKKYIIEFSFKFIMFYMCTYHSENSRLTQMVIPSQRMQSSDVQIIYFIRCDWAI